MCIYLRTYKNETTGVEIDFYEVTIKEFTANMFPDLGDATLIGYDGQAPGPTFRVKKGRETVIRFVNEYFRLSSVHLHGSYSRARGFSLKFALRQLLTYRSIEQRLTAGLKTSFGQVNTRITITPTLKPRELFGIT